MDSSGMFDDLIDQAAEEPWLSDDDLTVLRELVSARVRFLVIGGRAVQFHGHHRPAKDLDLLFEFSAENWARAATAMPRLNAGLPAFETLTHDRQHAHFPFYPMVEFVTVIRNVTFHEAWAESVEATFAGVSLRVISKAHLIRSKQGSVREVDISDVAALVDGPGAGRSPSLPQDER